MNIDKFLTNNSLWIMPNQIREKFIHNLEQKKLLNIKIMTISELKKHMLFDYGEKTIAYLINKYNYTYDISVSYLENMYYLKEINNELVNKIIRLKEELKKEKLLYFDNLFDMYINDKDIYIYGYDYLKKEDLHLVDILKKTNNITVINKEIGNNELRCFSFDSIDDEVEFVAIKIHDLILNGIEINNIKIANIDQSYKNIIKKIFKYYKIPIDLEQNKSLYSLKIAKDLIDLVNNNNDAKTIIQELKKTYDLEIVNSIVSIINKYVWTNLNKVIDLIIYDLKHTYIKEKQFSNRIELVDINNNIFDDSVYLFLLGFNNQSFPRYVKDEDLFSDQIKEKMNLSTSNEINKMISHSAINNLKLIKNLTITFKTKDDFENYYPSNLIEDLDIPVEYNNITIGKSKTYNMIKGGIYLDNLLKYNEHNKDLDILYNDSKFPYLSYDNKFKGIDSKIFKEYVNNELILSYTAINNYYECPFSFYLSNILNLNIYNDTIFTKIGILFHKVLENKDEEDFNLDICFQKEMNKIINKDTTAKEKFYLSKIKKEIQIVLGILNYQKSFSNLKKEEHEKRFLFEKNSPDYKKFVIKIKGYVDKIMYDEKNIAIIDYKTGYTTIDLSYLPFGLKMQLPMYIYLVKKCDEFLNHKIAGIYLQSVLNNIKGSKKGIEDEYKDSLKLYGYSNNNSDVLKEFDSSYEKSNVIRGMAVTNEGNFYYNSKIISDAQIDLITEIVDKNVDIAIKEIINCNFIIKPKRYNNNDLSCSLCEYKDICFKTESDYQDIELDKELTFLGGVDND